MRIPAPVNVPLRMGDMNSAVNSPAWLEWFQRLSDYYEAIAKYLDPGNTLFGKIEPSNPQEGLLAYADGTDWNPGSGAGYYRRNGPVWDYASAITPTTYVSTTTFNNHKARHQNGGADEISLAGLSGELADPQPTKFSDAEGDPAPIGTAADGTSVYAARRDHAHAGDHGALSGLADDDHPQYQKELEKDAASGYAGLNASSRGTKGIDTTDDIIIDLATKGLVLKDTQGTPHYWRLTINNTGTLVISDLGTSKP
jgi:hypothetical protein